MVKDNVIRINIERKTVNVIEEKNIQLYIFNCLYEYYVNNVKHRLRKSYC